MQMKMSNSYSIKNYTIRTYLPLPSLRNNEQCSVNKPILAPPLTCTRHAVIHPGWLLSLPMPQFLIEALSHLHLLKPLRTTSSPLPQQPLIAWHTTTLILQTLQTRCHYWPPLTNPIRGVNAEPWTLRPLPHDPKVISHFSGDSSS